MYTIRYEGGVMSEEQQAIEACVPDKLNRVVKAGLSVGDALIERWFGKASTPGGKQHDAFDEKRKKMSEYLNNQCTVLSFVKKPYGATVDSASVVSGDLAQVMRSCFEGDDSGFVPSGVRIYVLGTGLAGQAAPEQFNTIAHELSHRVINTTDAPEGKAVYGKSNALSLAGNSAEAAIQCAENWGYFYQEVMERLP